MFRVSMLLLASVSGLQAQAPAGPVPYSREKESALGAALARDLARRTHPLASDSVRQYIAALGDSLRQGLGAPGLTYTFTVVSDEITGPAHEPAALPGGYIFVPASLILEARDEAELAGMLAHSMAHVALRHGTRPEASLQNSASIPLIFMGGWDGYEGAGPVLISAGFLRQQREFELQADRDALRAMNSAGYNPNALLAYISRVQQPPRSERSAMPDQDTRLQNIEQAIRELTPAEYRTSVGFTSIQEDVKPLVPAPRPEPARPLTPPTLKRPGEP